MEGEYAAERRFGLASPVSYGLRVRRKPPREQTLEQASGSYWWSEPARL